MNYTLEFSSFVAALHDKDLKQANNVINTFHSGCKLDEDVTACAFYEVASENKHFKELKAEDFVEVNFNKEIKI
jgi:predicted transcriptional regulator